MRFISKYGKLIVQIRPQIEESYATGAVRVLQEAVSADFFPPREGGDLRPHEREAALNAWNFNGSYQEMDEATQVPPDYRIGVFDLDVVAADRGWSADLKAEVEAKLVSLTERHNHVIIAPTSSVPPPWPRYDEYGGGVAALVRKIVDEGHDLEQVLTYERETQNREKVVEALEAAIAGPVAEEDEVVVG